MEKNLRLVLMGTPEFAVPGFEAIVQAGWPVAGVVTAPDRPSGRGLQERPSAVKSFAIRHQLPLLQPERLRDPDFIAALKNWKADLQVVVAFRMLPEVVWSMPRLGSINLHASLLPAYRGAAPIQRAVMNGETKTGLSTFFLRHEIDTGDLLDQVSLDIGPEETSGELHDRMMQLGAEVLLHSLQRIASGDTVGIAQAAAEGLPKAPKIFREDGHIDWNRTSAHLHNHIRGLSPYPGAWCIRQKKVVHLYRSRLIKDSPAAASPGEHAGKEHDLPAGFEPVIGNPEENAPGSWYREKEKLFARTADGWLEILEIQPEGKKRMSVSAWLNGLPRSAKS